ncbi:leukocyte tyrosine kinase receptor [Bacillus rossius redtenbacheri]|uniref:leukocyte tyrosine kinase receptor n=1 Tax=Bacillus rossius redtenbacheri TaxID=93214 RepID=UPI002FDC8B9C
MMASLLVLAAAAAAVQHPFKYVPPPGLRCDFEAPCDWRWNDSWPLGFRLVSGRQMNDSAAPGPFTDADNNYQGHFLYLNVSGDTKQVSIWSPMYETVTREVCRLEMMLHMANMASAVLKVVINNISGTSWVIRERMGKDRSVWEKYNFSIGSISQVFRVIFEVEGNDPGHLGIDNVALVDCFPEEPLMDECKADQFRCDSGLCVERWMVCDIARDCLSGEDEEQDCDKLPPHGRCDFEDGWCGWENTDRSSLQWELRQGPTPNAGTGPSVDNTFRNATGRYLYVGMSVKGKQMGDGARMRSATFNPPPPCTSNSSSPYFNSCVVRFFSHQFGPHIGSLELFLVKEPSKHKEKRVTLLMRNFGNKGNRWNRHKYPLPQITHKYHLQFEARRGVSTKGDVAVDDISLSPECFGIGIPADVLNGYNYSLYEEPPFQEPHKDMQNKTFYVLTTCGAEGREGPTKEDCSLAYNNTSTKVAVLDSSPPLGVQRWLVPETGYYTIVAKGAGGGKGSNDDHETSRGAVVRAVVHFEKGQELFALVGQRGSDACKKHISSNHASSCKVQPVTLATLAPTPRLTSAVHKLHLLDIRNGGGGGGGATTLFLVNKDRQPIPLLVAAGGGGLGHHTLPNKQLQHAHGENSDALPVTGMEYGLNAAGAGGGWQANEALPPRNITGEALLQGARGGKACYDTDIGAGNGGFGGGGGGCVAGGGGGGFAGGSAWNDSFNSGEGGYSFFGGAALMTEVLSRPHSGAGSVHVVPSVYQGCGCDFDCVALDEYRHEVKCLCPLGWRLGFDNTSCESGDVPTNLHATLPIWVYVIGAIAAAVLCLFVVLICFFLCKYYNLYQRKKLAALRRRVLSGGPDLQLNRLREASDSMLTEYNPNYEFGGGTYTIRDLKDIPRDQLRLVKALGQGAFGEVYQGFFRHRAGDAVEMPVAVKTLPELSTNQAETDFLMEALIMSKFKHPNIVHFIGVCFDKHPRFIVLELLAGGDLKTFLRESRPKPDRPSPLRMKDLMTCAVDVAKGCKYMEDNRFIHRDIAARNCLLTTKGPGRVVKIADFGMARDIYRADYYRKGGKAMLPIKWMPPEAFLDGIFTSKTDVWSFGVLLWEVMSLGYMPYTGLTNREVMQLVTSGGRLEPPSNCPGPVYGIMTQCWHPSPDERPSFATILERLGYCTQDPNVISAPLPVFQRPPSTERDATIMRPPAHEDSCLQVQRAADYLVPLPAPEVPSSPSTSSVDKLLANSASDWETSFAMPESRSTQPLIEGGSCSSGEAAVPSAPDRPPAVGSLVSLEHASPNNNNNNNNKTGSLKGSMPLDPSALAKQPFSYVNVSVTPSRAPPSKDLDGECRAHPFTVQGAAARNILSDTEISC